MMNPLSLFLRKLKFWLLEERNDIYLENPKRRRQLHNAHLIQAWAAMTGITVIAIIPLILWFITLQYFVIVYVLASTIAGISYVTISLYIKHLNRQYELSHK